MRTGRTLTVFRCLVAGGGGIYPQRKKKAKKNFPSQKNWGVPPSHPPPLWTE